VSEKKIIKCAICDNVAEGEECQLMTVITNEKGEEVMVCCTHLAEQEK
jgi:hypothetical protein